MRISWFPAILSLIVAAAMAWLAYDIAFVENSDVDVYVALGTVVSVVLTLGVAMGCQMKNGKVAVNLKVWSIMMFVVMLISNFCFSSFGVKMPWYVVVTVCLLVVHLAVVRIIAGVKKV